MNWTFDIVGNVVVTNDAGWFYGYYAALVWHSNSFTVAPDLKSYLVDHGHASNIKVAAGYAPYSSAAPSDFAVGDVVMYDWGDGSPSGVDHNSIKVGYGSTDIGTGDYVDAHTSDRHHNFWDLEDVNTHWATTTVYIDHITD